MNSFLAQGVPQQDSRKNPFSWHRYPFLSRFHSQSGEKKDTSHCHYVSSLDSECEGTPVSSESFIASNKFHFSFYKWAGKGALLTLPTSPHEKAGNIIGVRSFPQVVVQGMDLIDEEDSMSTATGASKGQTDNEDYKFGKDGLFERKHSTNSTNEEGALPLVFDDYMQGDKAEETGVLAWTLWKTRNKMAIERNLPKQPSEVIFQFISCLQRWRVIVRKEDRQGLDEMLSTLECWLKRFCDLDVSSVR